MTVTALLDCGRGAADALDHARQAIAALRAEEVFQTDAVEEGVDVELRHLRSALAGEELLEQSDLAAHDVGIGVRDELKTIRTRRHRARQHVNLGHAAGHALRQLLERVKVRPELVAVVEQLLVPLVAFSEEFERLGQLARDGLRRSAGGFREDQVGC